jgi:hypothetical protein
VVRSLALQVGRVAVVAVGDQRAPRVQVVGHSPQHVRVGDGPHPVPQAVGQLGVHDERRPPRRAGGRHGRRRRTATVVDQEDRLEVGADRLVQGEPVAHGAGDGVLVRQHDPVLGGREPSAPTSPRCTCPSGADCS